MHNNKKGFKKNINKNVGGVAQPLIVPHREWYYSYSATNTIYDKPLALGQTFSNLHELLTKGEVEYKYYVKPYLRSNKTGNPFAPTTADINIDIYGNPVTISINEPSKTIKIEKDVKESRLSLRNSRLKGNALTTIMNLISKSFPNIKINL
jgi:hypothetical protein